MQMLSDIVPDSQEISDEVKKAVRVQELIEYGPDKLPAGPNVPTSDEVIIVEGRADVITLLKHGIKNVIAVEGTNVPKSLVDLTKMKTVIVFVDGDHGGELIVKELLHAGADIDMVTHAPPGREVEELTKKEIHKALRAAVPIEQYTSETLSDNGEHRSPVSIMRHVIRKDELPQIKTEQSTQIPLPSNKREEKKEEEQEMTVEDILKEMAKKAESNKVKEFRKIMEGLVGTRGAYVLDKDMKLITKIPIIELRKTIKERDSIYAIVFDGVITKKLVDMAEEKKISYLVGMKVVGITKMPEKTILLTPTELGEF